MPEFTDITHGFEPQNNMAEIVDATNERRLAAIASGATGLPDAIPTSSPQFYQGGAVKPTHLLIQEMLEALAPHYVDHDASDPILTPYTVATWRTAAGLHADGFKRATAWANPAADPTFGYGLIQTRDIAGYWIWVEIVAGLRALKWTRKTTIQGTSYQDKQFSVYYESGETAADFVPRAEGVINAASWGEGDYLRYLEITHYLDYRLGLILHRCYPRLALAVAAPVSADVEFWMKPVEIAADFWDPAGEAEGAWFRHGDQAWNLAAEAMNCDSDIYTFEDADIPANIITAAGIAAGGAKSSGVASNGRRVLIKWNFTRT